MQPRILKSWQRLKCKSFTSEHKSTNKIGNLRTIALQQRHSDILARCEIRLKMLNHRKMK